MTRIIADISVPLDGFVTEPDPGKDSGKDSGKDLEVVLMGGGATIGSALDAGLVDALTPHLAPLVPSSGRPLFTGTAPRTPVQRSVTPTSTATHLTYDGLG